MKYFLLILLSCNICRAATITALSVSQVDVQNAVNSAVDGVDTVVIPSGSAYWTTNVTITSKSIKIRGSETNLTTIYDAMPNSKRSGLPTVFKVTLTNLTSYFDLSHIKIITDGTNKTPGTAGAISLRATGNWAPVSSLTGGTNAMWRIHDITFGPVYNRPMYIYAWNGLVDNVQFNMNSGVSGIAIDGRVPSTEYGDKSWNRPIYYGTTNEGVYFEHCSVLSTQASTHAFCDGFAGARYVFRYMIVQNHSLENHGPESAPRYRGTRWTHFYGNTASNPSTSEKFILLRSGSGWYHDNNVTGYGGFLRAVDYRTTTPYPNWREANGLGLFDDNDPVVYDTAIHNGGDNVTTFQDTTKTWTVDQFKFAYNIINLDTTINSLSKPNSSLIAGNGLNTIICQLGQGSALQRFTNGNHIAIMRVRTSLDQVGVGEGDLLSNGSGSPPVDPTPVGWPHEIDLPIYIFNNTGISQLPSIDIANGGYHIVTNRHYIVGTTPPGYALLPDPSPLASGISPTYPTISSMTNILIVQNSNTGPLPFTITGLTNITNCVISAASSNPTLMPSSGFAYGGSGSNRTVTCTPVSGLFGIAPIIVTVTDEQGLSSSSPFTLTVNMTPGNNPPTITTVANQTIGTNSSTGLLNFIVGDNESSPSSLIMSATSSDTSVIPSSFIIFGGSNSNRTVNVFSTNIYGLSKITMSVSDGTTNTTTYFDVGVPPPPTLRNAKARNLRVNTLK